MALAWTIDAKCPVQTGVKPLRAVGRSHLIGQHVAHFVEISRCILFAVEVAAFPCPIGPGTSKTIEHLTRVGFAAEALLFRNTI